MIINSPLFIYHSLFLKRSSLNDVLARSVANSVQLNSQEITLIRFVNGDIIWGKVTDLLPNVTIMSL